MLQFEVRYAGKVRASSAGFLGFLWTLDGKKNVKDF